MGIFSAFKEGWHTADEELAKEEEIENYVQGRKMTLEEAKSKWLELKEKEHNEEFLEWCQDMEIQLITKK